MLEVDKGFKRKNEAIQLGPRWKVIYYWPAEHDIGPDNETLGAWLKDRIAGQLSSERKSFLISDRTPVHHRATQRTTQSD